MRAPGGARILASTWYYASFRTKARRSTSTPTADRLDSGIEPRERLGAKSGNIGVNAAEPPSGKRVVSR